MRLDGVRLTLTLDEALKPASTRRFRSEINRREAWLAPKSQEVEGNPAISYRVPVSPRTDWSLQLITGFGSTEWNFELWSVLRCEYDLGQRIATRVCGKRIVRVNDHCKAILWVDGYPEHIQHIERSTRRAHLKRLPTDSAGVR